MVAVDANILLSAVNSASPFHPGAKAFMQSLASRQDVAISELSLVEFYVLLRNPAVLTNPLKAFEAVEVVQAYRYHPHWMLLGFDPDSVGLHDELWPLATQRSIRSPSHLRRPPGTLAPPSRRGGVRHRKCEGLPGLWFYPRVESLGCMNFEPWCPSVNLSVSGLPDFLLLSANP